MEFLAMFDLPFMQRALLGVSHWDSSSHFWGSS